MINVGRKGMRERKARIASTTNHRHKSIKQGSGEAEGKHREFSERYRLQNGKQLLQPLLMLCLTRSIQINRTVKMFAKMFLGKKDKVVVSL